MTQESHQLTPAYYLSHIVRLTEFGPKFLLNSLFILFYLFSLLVSTLGIRDGVWHDMMIT